MSAVPVAQYLIEFGPGGSAGKQSSSGSKSRPANDVNAVDLAAKIETAFSRGLAEGRCAAQAEFDTKLSEQQQAFEQRLSSERDAWASQQGARLAEQLLSGLADIEARIAQTSAIILRPFLIEQLHRQAMADLSEALDALISKDRSLALEISGPEDLLGVLRERLADKTVAVTFSPSDGCDVRVVAGQTTLETSLGAWLAKIREAVA